MSLLATTVSIVLTFGTTAIVDRKKQRAEKREMVRPQEAAGRKAGDGVDGDV